MVDGHRKLYPLIIFIVYFFQEFAATLDLPTKGGILVHLLRMGRRRPDFAKTLVTVDSATEPPSSDTQAPDWCKLRICLPMHNDEENVCCRRVACFTRFQTLTIANTETLCIKARYSLTSSTFAAKPLGKLVTASLHHSKLGKGNRRVLPACVVSRIKAQYPAPYSRYMGYRAN